MRFTVRKRTLAAIDHQMEALRVQRLNYEAKLATYQKRYDETYGKV